MSCLEKYLFRDAYYLFALLACFLISHCMSYLYILKINWFSVTLLVTNTSSYSIGYLFMYGFFCCENAFKFN